MISILDSMMGTGKTTGIFNKIREEHRQDHNKKFLYIGLFIQEVGDGNTGREGRVQKSLPELDFRMPKNMGEGKLEGLKTLVRKGHNISSTHSLFSMFDLEVVQLLTDNNYTLIIDEAVDAISVYKDIKKSDIELLTNTGIISTGEGGRIVWCGDQYTTDEYDGKYLDIKELCALGSLYWHHNEVLIWEYPPKLLSSLQEVIIITYMFEGSIMSSWLKINGIEYSYLDTVSFGLLPNSFVMEQVRNNLSILEPPSLSKIKNCSLSVNWFEKKATSENVKAVKKVMETCLNTHKLKVGDVFWTTFKSKKHKLEGVGYTRVPKNGLDPFLPWNTKATNDYMHHKCCMYAVNVFKSPVEVEYLASKGIEFDEDKYALSMMVQFIWRGCIRKGEPMKVLVLSKRMRELLKEWVKNG